MGRCFITDNKIMKTVSEQLAMFEGPDAGKQVLQYVKNGHALCKEAQIKIFELENTLEIVKKSIVFLKNTNLK